MSILEDLRKAEADRRAAVEAMQAADRRILECRLQLAREAYGIEPGLMVRDRKGRVGIVSEVEPWGTGGKPWVSAKLLKKDGSPGEREINFYGDWEITSRADQSRG